METPKKIKRTDSISLETARKKFHEYYNKKNPNPIARMRAKLFDMMYQKKPKYMLYPNQPGSARYLLENGPKTFDMYGVDAFDEGEEFYVGDPDYPELKGVSRGPVKPDSDEQYGPMLRSSMESYSDHFKKQYDKQFKSKNKNLVQLFWDKYKKNPSQYKRKNKIELPPENTPYLTEEHLSRSRSHNEGIFSYVKRVNPGGKTPFTYDSLDYYVDADLDIYVTDKKNPMGTWITNVDDISKNDPMLKHLLDRGILEKTTNQPSHTSDVSHYTSRNHSRRSSVSSHKDDHTNTPKEYQQLQVGDQVFYYDEANDDLYDEQGMFVDTLTHYRQHMPSSSSTGDRVMVVEHEVSDESDESESDESESDESENEDISSEKMDEMMDLLDTLEREEAEDVSVAKSPKKSPKKSSVKSPKTASKKKSPSKK